MKKKLISLTMAAVMGMSLLVGCGQTNQQTETKESEVAKVESTATESTPVAESEAPKEIENIVVYFQGGETNVDKDKVVDAMNEYSEEKIGVTMTFKPIASGEYTDTISRALAAKEDVDIIWASASIANSFVPTDGALEITELIKNYPDLKAAMPEMIWESVKMNGGNYYIPNYKETGSSMSIMTPAAVADAVKAKTGIDFNAIEMNSLWDMGNMEEYILAAMDVADLEAPFAENFKIGDWLNNGGVPGVEILTKPYYIDTATNTVYNMYDLPGVEEYITLMNSWVDKGIMAEKLILSDYKSADVMKAGKFAIAGWITVPNNEVQAESRYGIDLYVKQVTEPVVTGSSATGSGWLIAKASKHADAAMKWLELLNTDTTFADMFVYGLEGTHYTKDANGVLNLIKDSGWSMPAYKCTNYKVMSLTSADAANKVEAYTEYNAQAKPSPILGFKADFTEVEAERAAANTIYMEHHKTISAGFESADTLKDIAKQNEGIGQAKLLEEIQGQVDEAFGK